MVETRIRLQNLSKYYYSDTSVVQALRKIDLCFGMNEFVVITGESGSGKSTLLKIISGMEDFDEGELLIDGEPTSQYDDNDWECYRREKIGYIFQDYSLIQHYSVRNNIVSALMIMGESHKQAVRKANYYLKRVGLKGMEKKPASKLSSGQKQRLSIARALAKGTDIIVADEPTGNLDSETGEQIVRLLKELSRDHLVIMVTHNYQQVEPYATRRVRLHNGELILDVGNGKAVSDSERDHSRESNNGAGEVFIEENDRLSQKKDTDVSENLDSKSMENSKDILFADQSAELSAKQGGDRFYTHGVASFLARLNIRTQPGITLMFLLFSFVILTASFFFIGEILMNADDRLSMEYDNSAFPKEDNTRIIAKRQDRKPITEQDMDVIRPMDHVVLVDQYDSVNDINYYYKENQDYQCQYGYINEESYSIDNIEFLDDSHFMRSSSCISQEDLAAGSLPQKRGEVVLYSKEGKDIIGTSFTCYLKHKPLWGREEYVKWDFTVVGILREETDQVYFSPAMCQMLTAMLDYGKYTMTFFFIKEAGRYLGKDDFIPMIGEQLQGDEMQVSQYYKTPLNYKDSINGGESNLPKKPEDIFGTPGYLWYKDYLEIFHRDSKGGWEKPIKLNATNVKTDDLHLSSGVFLAVSEEWFAQYNDMNTYQASVFISSYAKTTEVLSALRDAGYEAISTYQASVREYDPEKAEGRLTHLAIALAVLFVTLIAEILILGSLMKLRCKDYYVWKFMGMDRKLMHRIGYYEMGAYLVAGLIFAVTVMRYAAVRIAYIHEMWYYYELPGWLCFLFYNLIAAVLTVAVFHRYLNVDISHVNGSDK